MKIVRPILFCLLCAITLGATSGLFKSIPVRWNEHLILIIAIAITYGLTVLFSRWEGLPLKNVGVVPGTTTFVKLAVGFGLGFLMTALQAVIVLLLGHFRMAVSPAISAYPIFFYLVLYILVATREELAFRGYPLFSLNYSSGAWISLAIMTVLFAIEHIVGGMRWSEAFLGPGMGALLFGIAAVETKGIALPLGLHTAWNFGQWCFGFKKETGIFSGVVDKGFENVVERNGWISYLFIIGVAVVIFYFYRPKSR